MISIQHILKRTDIWGIRSFLLEDGPLPEGGFEDYETHIKKSEKPLYTLLERTFPDGKELDAAFDLVGRAFTAREDVYFEMGLRAGVRLLYALLRGSDSL